MAKAERKSDPWAGEDKRAEGSLDLGAMLVRAERIHSLIQRLASQRALSKSPVHGQRPGERASERESERMDGVMMDGWAVVAVGGENK